MLLNYSFLNADKNFVKPMQVDEYDSVNIHADEGSATGFRKPLRARKPLNRCKNRRISSFAEKRNNSLIGETN